MTVSEMLRFVEEKRRPFISNDEYKKYNISTSCVRIDFHKSFEFILYLGGCRISPEEYKQIESFTNRLKIQYVKVEIMFLESK